MLFSSVLHCGDFRLSSKNQRGERHYSMFAVHQVEESCGSEIRHLEQAAEHSQERKPLTPTEASPIIELSDEETDGFVPYSGTLQYFPLFQTLGAVFGFRAIVMFALTYFLSKGMTGHVLSGTTLPMFKDVFGLDSNEYQKYITIGIMGWSMKPLIGVVSDAVSLNGFHKRWYMFAASVTCCIAIMIYASLPGGSSANPVPGWVAPAGGAILFTANFCCALLDLLPEGRYSELMAQRPEHGSAIVSWVWAFVMLGGGVAAMTQGPLADAGFCRVSVLVGCVCQGALAFPLYKNWFGEKRMDGEFSELPRRRKFCVPTIKTEWSIVAKHSRIVAYCLLMAFCTLAMAVTTVLGSKLILLVVTLFVTVVLSSSSFFVLPRTIALSNLFMFLKEMLYVQLPGPLDYFYTADNSCLPDGPQFSYSFYQTFTVVVGYIAGAAGVTLFHRVFSKKSFRFTFWATTMIKIAASCVDIVIIKRWNRTVLNVGDHWVYFLGDAVVFGMCQMLDFMPAVVLTSKLCPKGMEATMYAMLAGFSNLGQVMSNTVGSLLTQFVFPIRTTIPCDFSNLAGLVFLGHFAMPLLVIPLTWYMIPDVQLDAEVTVESTPVSQATE